MLAGARGVASDAKILLAPCESLKRSWTGDQRISTDMIREGRHAKNASSGSEAQIKMN
jgi:hypothetical protein